MRHAYAASENGETLLKFDSTAERNYFLMSRDGFRKGTYGEYHRMERRHPNFALDMSILEYWDAFPFKEEWQHTLGETCEHFYGSCEALIETAKDRLDESAFESFFEKVKEEMR